jgi:hypothetical protein
MISRTASVHAAGEMARSLLRDPQATSGGQPASRVDVQMFDTGAPQNS